MATNIGMMDSAYFVGRSEILSWINSTLQLNLSKVEEVRPWSRVFLFLLTVSNKSNRIFPIAGLFRCGSLSAHGFGSSRYRSHAQSQFWCQERVRDDPELQGSSRRLQQTQDHQGISLFSKFVTGEFSFLFRCFLSNQTEAKDERDFFPCQNR